VLTPRLTDRLAVVTGAASGIGAAVVERFVAEGAFVIGLDRSRDAERHILAAAERGGDLARAQALSIDVTDDASIGAGHDERQ
jgi:NAD(P)-dependent dehydrogenase (short-subunit alcohol dehydrogenase family)